jgi:hypothetical protein
MKTTNSNPAMTNLPPMGGNSTGKESGVSLKQLINQLLGNSMATAFRSHSLVINEVSRDIQLSKDKAAVVPVLRDLLATVVANARKGNIYISAERFRDILTVQIQERNNYNGYALGYSVHAMESDATMVGANISIQGEKQLVTTISFSFANQAASYQYEC